MSLREDVEPVEDGYPEGFRFENKGDYLEGILQEIKDVDLKDGPAVAWVIKDAKGKNWTVWATKRLKSLMAAAVEKHGDVINALIGVEYIGEKALKTSPGRFKDYNLFVRKV